jgi:hypothetical protein
VGYYDFNENADSAQLVEHWDGNTWTAIAGADTGLSDVILDAVSARSSSNVWALGTGKDSQGFGQAVVEHWDGVSWSFAVLPQVANQTITPSGIAIAPTGAVWVVGTATDPTTVQQITVAMHWDGSSWAIVPSANVGSVGSGFGAIGVSPTTGEVWAVGWHFLSNGFAADHVLIERWNGSAFVQWPYGDGTSPTQYGYLVSVAPVADGAVLAAGSTGTNNATSETLAEEYLRTVPRIPCPAGA